jgi:hypothetical protein
MFKIFGNIILAAYLLISTTGFTVSKHYCGGEMTNVAVNHEAASCCGGGCDKCHTENEFVKLDEDLVAPVHFETPQIAQVDLMLAPVFLFDQAVVSETPLFAFRSESPPGRSGPDLFKTYQSFLL